MKKLLNHYKIGILGHSSSGKSSFIQKILKKEDGLDEQTGLLELSNGKKAFYYGKQVQYYELPNHNSFNKLQDYFNQILSKIDCDIYVYVYSKQLELRDVEIIKLIEKFLVKPVLIVRNKIDIDYDKKIEMSKLLNEKYNPALLPLFDDKFTQEKFKINLLSCLDFKQHGEALENIINDIAMKMPLSSLFYRF